MSNTNGNANMRLSCFMQAFDEPFGNAVDFLFGFLKHRHFFSGIQDENRHSFATPEQLLFQCLLVEAPGFPQQPFDAVAVDRPFEQPCTNANAYLQMMLVVFELKINAKGKMRKLLSAGKELADLLAALEPFGGRKFISCAAIHQKEAPAETGALYIVFGQPRNGDFIFLNRARRKRSVYDDLLLGGWPILYDRWLFACVDGNRERIYGDGRAVGRFFSFQALFYVFPFTNWFFVFTQQGTIPVACERDGKGKGFQQKREAILKISGLQMRFFALHRRTVECGCPGIEVGRIARGKKAPLARLADLRFHFGVPLQVIGQAFRHDRPLGDNLHGI